MVDHDGKDSLTSGDFSLEAEPGSVADDSATPVLPESAPSGNRELKVGATDRGDGRIDVSIENASIEAVVLQDIKVKDDCPFILLMDEQQFPVLLNPGEVWRTQLAWLGGSGRDENARPESALVLDTSRRLPVANP